MTFEIDKEETEEIIAKIKELDEKAIIKESDNGEFIEITTTLRGFLTRYEEEHYIHIHTEDDRTLNIPIEIIETIWGL